MNCDRISIGMISGRIAFGRSLGIQERK